MTNGAPRFTLLGVNDDHDTCSLCGRTNLKRVAWLAPLDADGNEAGEAAPYGTDCAGALLLGRKDRKNTELVRSRGEALELARRLLAAGHPAAKVAQAVWNRTGYSADAAGDAVRVWIDRTAPATIITAAPAAPAPAGQLALAL